MDLKLTDTQRNELRSKAIAIYLDVFDEEISDFKADRILDAFVEKLAPAIYNIAIQDMKQFMFTQLEDMEAIHSKESKG